jgi:catechol 2,3-dioxygenase-like lactoylglutathione lyase family enzyme
MRKRLAIVSVPVSSQKHARDFYVDVMGFELKREGTIDKKRNWVQLALPKDDTSITLVTWLDTMPPGSLRGIVINTDDIETYHAELVGKGVSPSKISTAPWGSYFTVADPDGNSWLVQQDPR